MKALLIVIIVIATFICQAEATQRLRFKRQMNQPKAEKRKTLEELQKEHTLQEWVKEQREAGGKVPYIYSPSTRPYCSEYYIHIRTQFQNLTAYQIKGLHYTIRLTDTFDNLLLKDEITEAINITPWGTAKSDGKLLTNRDNFEKIKLAIEQKMVKVTITVKKIQWANGKTTDNNPAQPTKETTENQPKEAQ